MSTKTHAIVDERGFPVKLLLTPEQASDKAAAPTMLEGLPTAQAFVGDRGYDWQALVDLVKTKGGCAHIPAQREGTSSPPSCSLRARLWMRAYESRA